MVYSSHPIYRIITLMPFYVDDAPIPLHRYKLGSMSPGSIMERLIRIAIDGEMNEPENKQPLQPA
jgi:hypothetical protein